MTDSKKAKTVHKSICYKMLPFKSQLFTICEVWGGKSWRYFIAIFAGVLVARGCSTKRPLFHIECENHKSGTKSEEFCYCSYDLCNSEESTKLDKVISILVFGLLITIIFSLWQNFLTFLHISPVCSVKLF